MDFSPRRRLATTVPMVVILVSLMMLLAVGVTQAARTQGSCLDSDNNKSKLFENSEGDISDDDDNLWLCAGSVNLHDVEHEKSGGCKYAGGSNNHWGDCVSSYKVWSGADRSACYYSNINHDNEIDSWLGVESGVRYEASVNDALSSVKHTDPGVSCP